VRDLVLPHSLYLSCVVLQSYRGVCRPCRAVWIPVLQFTGDVNKFSCRPAAMYIVNSSIGSDHPSNTVA